MVGVVLEGLWGDDELLARYATDAQDGYEGDH